MPRPKAERTIAKIAVTLYQDQIDELRQLSASDERPLSVHLRRAVDKYLEEMRKTVTRYLEEEG